MPSTKEVIAIAQTGGISALETWSFSTRVAPTLRVKSIGLIHYSLKVPYGETWSKIGILNLASF
jgi:hypothetical protein